MEQRTNPKLSTSFCLTQSSIFLLVAFAMIYLGLFFPFAYFRHDDWVIIGNGVLQLPKDWSFAFKPTLILNATEVVWFFRPFFKMGAYLFYHLFGYQYFAWLTATLLLTVAALALSFSTLMRLTRSPSSAILFLVLFVCSMQFHFGSVVWIGEGLMNCPVIFLLSLNTWLFVKGIQDNHRWRRDLYYIGGVVAFLASLGFKEIGILHIMFLLALLLFEPTMKEKALRSKIAALVPYGVLGTLFLYFRLWILPINPGYVPQLHVGKLSFPLIALAGSLIFPSLVLSCTVGFTGRSNLANFLRSLISRWFYVLFLFLCISPYLGHNFFSPGWLLLPGYYLCFVLALSMSGFSVSRPVLFGLGFVLLGSSLAAILWKTQDVQWWSWHHAQRQIITLFRDADAAKIKQVKVFVCSKNPQTSLERVVGSTDSLGELWELIHGTRVPILLTACPAERNRVEGTGVLNLIWEFPIFTVLRS